MTPGSYWPAPPVNHNALHKNTIVLRWWLKQNMTLLLLELRSYSNIQFSRPELHDHDTALICWQQIPPLFRPRQCPYQRTAVLTPTAWHLHNAWHLHGTCSHVNIHTTCTLTQTLIQNMATALRHSLPISVAVQVLKKPATNNQQPPPLLPVPTCESHGCRNRHGPTQPCTRCMHTSMGSKGSSILTPIVGGVGQCHHHAATVTAAR
jgi:hypothetical protein